MNILKLICGLLLLDFLLKKSKSPDSQAHSEAGEYNLLRTSEKNQRYKSQEKERKQTAATHELQGYHQSRNGRSSIIRVVKNYNENKNYLNVRTDRKKKNKET